MSLIENIRPSKRGASSPQPEMSLFTEDQEAERWLEKLLLEAHGRVATFTVRLTPSRAKALLKRNAHNRRLSENTVLAISRDIRNGAWAFNGETIILTGNGDLNDGQHRCAAVIEAGIAVDVILVIGTSRESRFTVDQGRARMSGDYLGMNGHKDSLVLAAAAANYWQYVNHGRLSQQALYRPTKGEVLNTVERNSGIAHSLECIQRKGSDSVGGRGILTFCHFVFSQRSNEPSATAFMTALVQGAGLGPKDPILYARNRLMAERGRLKPNEKAELIFRAWNCHRRREMPRTLPILDGALPDVER